MIRLRSMRILNSISTYTYLPRPAGSDHRWARLGWRKTRTITMSCAAASRLKDATAVHGDDRQENLATCLSAGVCRTEDQQLADLCERLRSISKAVTVGTVTSRAQIGPFGFSMDLTSFHHDLRGNITVKNSKQRSHQKRCAHVSFSAPPGRLHAPADEPGWH